MPNLLFEKEEAIQRWLQAVGLGFNPFICLDASSDSHLLTYWVGHDAFAVAWGDWPTFVFAPPGGGKTALKLRGSQACWMGQETNRPFPVSYLPPFLKWGHTCPTVDEHLIALVQAGALHLLLILSHRPHWFMRLDDDGRRIIRQALEWNLQGPLGSYLEPCLEEGNLTPLQSLFPPAMLPPDPPRSEALIEFSSALLQTPVPPTKEQPTSQTRWQTLIHALLGIIGFPSVYLLLDGLDAIGETAEDPEMAIRALSPLLSLAPEWAEQRLFFKAFIPVETLRIIQQDYSSFFSRSQSLTLDWTPALLAEIVRRRVYVASQGNFGSLGMVASPLLRDIEVQMAKEVYPLPREMLVLTQRVIEECAGHMDTNLFIQKEDVDSAFQWYRQNAVLPQLMNLELGGRP